MNIPETTVDAQPAVEPAAVIHVRPAKAAKTKSANPKNKETKQLKPAAVNEPAQAKDTKAEIVVRKLSTSKGATIEQLIELTGWQAHSVRGFLSATVKKKLQLNLISESGKDGVRRYRIAATAAAG